jgi:sugar fermentation stimulation protein A
MFLPEKHTRISNSLRLETVSSKPLPTTDRGLSWPRLISGALIARYKRFMADVKLGNGHVVTAHCPNSGSMKGCSEPGSMVWISRSNNLHRRLRYTWEMIKTVSSLVGVNTLVPNRLVAHSIVTGQISELSGYEKLYREVKCGTNSRLDLLLERPTGELCFIEVKNCTLVRDGVAYFPDAVTSRGRKHLVELQEQVKAGNRGVIFFLIQRMDAKTFSPADHIDPAYGNELRAAFRHGVEILAYDVNLNLERIAINKRLPCML